MCRCSVNRISCRRCSHNGTYRVGHDFSHVAIASRRRAAPRRGRPALPVSIFARVPAYSIRWVYVPMIHTQCVTSAYWCSDVCSCMYVSRCVAIRAECQLPRETVQYARLYACEFLPARSNSINRSWTMAQRTRSSLPDGNLWNLWSNLCQSFLQRLDKFELNMI